MKQNLLERIGLYLLKGGFTIKSLTRTSFDIIARKGSLILLLKILEDANAINEEHAREMERVASYINGSPLIIAEKAGDRLQDNVVYSRFGINTLNFTTFKNCVEKRFPFVKRDHSGLKARLIGRKLKMLREEEGVSLGDIARKTGVSKRMILKYEAGECEITIKRALKIYKVFGNSVFDKINVFQSSGRLEHCTRSDIAKKYSELGFDTLQTKKTPFDIMAKREKELILTQVGDKTKPGFEGLSSLVDADRLVIFKKKKPKDIPAMTKEEFMEFERASELIKFLREF